MTKLKTLTAISVLISVIAGPAFAQDAGMPGPKHHGRAHELRDYRGVYNRVDGPYATPRTPRMLDRPDTNGFGFGGRDPSWVGGKDPSLNPAGN